MKTISIVMLALAIAVCAATVWAGGVGSAVDVRIVTDDGRTLPTYPVKTRSGVQKVHAEAVKGDHYRIEVRNRLNRRVGLVIAVDGRNIISGAKSWLKNSERMYILEPYGSGQFSGWRTSQDRVNRFFFTDAPRVTSFAEATRCDVERFKRFFHAMLKEGVYLAPSAFEAGFISSAHGAPEIEATLAAARRAFEACR